MSGFGRTVVPCLEDAFHVVWSVPLTDPNVAQVRSYTAFAVVCTLGTGHYLVGGGGGGEGGGGLLNEEKTLAKKLWPSLLKDPKISDPPLTPFKKIVTLPKDKIVKQYVVHKYHSEFILAVKL